MIPNGLKQFLRFIHLIIIRLYMPTKGVLLFLLKCKHLEKTLNYVAAFWGEITWKNTAYIWKIIFKKMIGGRNSKQHYTHSWTVFSKAQPATLKLKVYFSRWPHYLWLKIAAIKSQKQTFFLKKKDVWNH